MWTCSEVQQELQALQKHKDSFPEFVLLGQEGPQSSAYILPSSFLSRSSKHSSGERRGSEDQQGAPQTHIWQDSFVLSLQGAEVQRQSNIVLGNLGYKTHPCNPGPWVRADTGQGWGHNSPLRSETGGFRGPSLTSPSRTSPLHSC